MATKLDREVASDEKMLLAKLHIPLVGHVGTSGHMTNKKCSISILTRPVATKLDRMVAYDKK